MGDLRTSAPVFIAVLLGIYLLAAGVTIGAAIAVLALFYFGGWGFGAIAGSRLAGSPVAAVKIWQWAVLTPIAIIAASTYATTYVSFEAAGWIKHLPDWMVDKTWLDAKETSIGATLVGALNTLIAALWLDNAKQPTGKLWPSGQIKEAFEKTFRGRINELRQKPEPGRSHDDLERAVSGDLATQTISGWDYDALIGRAAIIATFLTRPAKS